MSLVDRESSASSRWAAEGPAVSQAHIETHVRPGLAWAGGGGIVARGPAGATAPVSFSQQQLWLHARLEPDVPVYSEPVTIHHAGYLDVRALERSLAEIIRRHEAWRTTFTVVDGELRQVINAPAAIALPVVDLRGLPPAAREDEALRLATEDARRPFDLEHGPLLRATLVQLADAEHRLFLTLHHIIFDGVALYRVFLPEFAALYEAFAAGGSSPLAEPPIQYADFARWQHETQAGSEMWTRQLAHWQRSLLGAPALELPTDRPRPPVQSFRGAMERLAFSKTATRALKALSARERATLYMTMLTAFTVLLHRYSGQDDLVVGTVTAGRKRLEVEQLLGYFLNPLALRLDCSGDPTFRELLARVRDVALDALSNDDVPFERVVHAVQPQRDRDRNPLFQVMFSLEPPLPPLPVSWALTQLDVETGTAKFDLYLELDDRPDGMIGRFLYRTDLFEPATIARMVGHLHTLVDAIVADPEQRLSALPLLTPAERRQLLVEWNDTASPYPSDSTVHVVFENQVQCAPGAGALVFGKETVTYGELNARANQVAHRLRALGVGPDVAVGVCMERTPDMVVAFLGILKAGGAYVPLDPFDPAERLAFMLDDSGASAVLTHRHHRSRLPSGRAAICFDTDDTLGGESELNPAHQSTPEGLAYVMYTSGSTGAPKAVEISHRGILRLLFGVSYARLGAGEVFVQGSSPSFDLTTFELWGALLHGGQCVLCPGRVPTPDALRALIRTHGVTTLWLTAALFNSIIDTAPDALQGVHQLLVGGEALSVSHIRRAFEALTDVQIVNGYGPTEATTFACCYRLPGPPDPEATSIPIGPPIENTRVYVLDRYSNPVPVGVPGELYIGGPGVARGYRNRPELTAERFVSVRFGTEREERCYRTGDLVRWRPDGSLDYLGRLDTQVKIRGFRVEPGEIETLLARHPAVRAAAVVANEQAGVGKRLMAYVVTSERDGPAPSVLREFLSRSLPAYMIPSLFVRVDALPLTPSGKLDRRALPAPVPSTAERKAPISDGRDPLECQLIEIWEDVLGAHPIGVMDNFFDLGGHSLVAVRLAQRCERAFGTRLPLATLYAHPTIESLAATLVRHETSTISTPLVRIQEGPRRPFFFFHGDVNGGGFYCLNFARALGPEQPFYAVHPLGLDGQAAPATIEAMAAAHLEVVRAAQPHGPYRLGGYCNGGLVAYEVARLLCNAGETVEALVLVATAADTRWRRLRALSHQLVSFFAVPADTVLDAFARFRWLTIRLARTSNPFRVLVDTVVRRVRWEANLGVDTSSLRNRAIYEWYFRAALAYVPATYPGSLVVFWPTEEPWPSSGDATMGWGALTREVHVYPVPAGHNTIVTRQLDVLAHHVRALLARSGDPRESDVAFGEAI